jgi:H2-forming N5,N10-methylenetetrahydromethanopterin dehydrogenase-like enzyme
MLGPRASEVQDDDAVEQVEQAGRAVVDGARESHHDHLLLLPAPPWYKTTHQLLASQHQSECGP